jgi:hypothetical protein
MADEGKDKKSLIKIKVDNDHFEVEGPTITGAEVRALPEPDIGEDRDLFLTVHGPDPDRPISDSDEVEVEKNMHFFTAPRQITPGEDAANR